MSLIRRRFLAAVTLLLAAPVPVATADDTPGRLLQSLREGGYVLYFRHAETDWSQRDQPRSGDDVASCDGGLMRQLSDQGRRTAQRVGAAMRALGIPVGAVYSSEYCRCVETAEGLGLGAVTTTRDVINARSAELVGGREALRARARGLLATAPRTGSNTVVVAHGNIALLVGLERPPEGGAVVLRPLGGERFEKVGEIGPRGWTIPGGE